MAAAKKNLYEHEGGQATNRVDVRVLFDGIGWHELKDGSVAEQRASTRYHEVADSGEFASIPEHELERLESLGAVAKKGTKAEKEAVKAEEERQEKEAAGTTVVPVEPTPAAPEK